MLAEQHCVCTKSGLKNVFSTRCVVGRQRERGRRTFFLKMALEHSKSQHPAPFRNIISDSFWECWECRSLSCCPLNPAEKTSDSQGQPVPEHGVRHQKDHSKNMQRRGADACWLPSQHTPNWILEGVQEFATAILIQKKKKKIEKMCPFPVKKTKGLLPVAGTTPKPLSVLRSKSHLPEPTSSLAKHQAKFLTACQIYSVPQSSA